MIFLAPIHLAKCNVTSEVHCFPSHNSSIYKNDLTAFTAKMLVMFIAIITELLVAIKAHKKTALFTARWCHSSKCHKVFQIILLWNTFVFVQIWLGLVCLPVCIFLLFTPLQTISVVCATVGAFASIAATIMCLLQLGNQCYARTCKFGRDCGHISWCLIILALVATVGTFYFYLLPQRTSISSTMGVILSCLPPVVLSVTSWVSRESFLAKISQRKTKSKSQNGRSAAVYQQRRRFRYKARHRPG